MATIKHINIKIYGRVQGVGFRFFVKRIAFDLNIFGWVKNMSDGSVYIEAEGSEKDLRKLLKIFHQGPAFSKVEKIEHKLIDELKNFFSFVIKY